jgi:hypothetical protein
LGCGILPKSVGCFRCRHSLYPKQGEFLIGLDDDAHPLKTDFIALTISIFENPGCWHYFVSGNKGIFNSDEEALTKFGARGKCV